MQQAILGSGNKSRRHMLLCRNIGRTGSFFCSVSVLRLTMRTETELALIAFCCFVLFSQNVPIYVCCISTAPHLLVSNISCPCQVFYQSFNFIMFRSFISNSYLAVNRSDVTMVVVLLLLTFDLPARLWGDGSMNHFLPAFFCFL